MPPKKVTNNPVIKEVSSKNTNKSIEEMYQSMTQEQHILARPDSYVGDIQPQVEAMYVYDDANDKIIERLITYVPGLYKIFDEILVNARDQAEVDNTCDTIMVNVNAETNEISVYNNGKGIDIAIHSEHKIYVPELIFGKLLTSTNYDDTEQRTTGGRNGYGAKLTNIFSSKFVVETVDFSRKLKFTQEFTNNMSVRSQAIVEPAKTCKTGYTKITFIPDFSKFKLTGLTSDIISLFKKRVYDLAGVSNKCKVYYNDKKIECKDFKSYIGLYHFDDMPEEENNDSDQVSNPEILDDDNIETYKLFFEQVNSSWEVGFMYAPDAGNKQISFINGICTYHGGTHVNYVQDIVVNKLKDIITKKYKDITIKPNQIKENLIVFIKCVIVNPSFTSQTKETLKTKVSDFGSQCNIKDTTLSKFAKSGILNQVVNLIKLKEQAILKKTDGKKVTNLKGIPKLEDANKAGGKESNSCKLILTEGDSAKALAMSGRAVIGSDYYGIFPLKGKLLNVREATAKQLLENEEIINIKKIMGLQHEKDYEDANSLRYGGIVLMTDQDSVSGDTPLTLKNPNGEIEIQTIDSLTNVWNFKQEILDYNNIKLLSTKEYGNISGYQVWTENGWSNIENIMRHKVTKHMYRVLTHTGCVDVTEDHSLLNEDGSKLRAIDCKINSILLHKNYYFEHNKTNIPENLQEISIDKLQHLAKSLKIQRYQEFRKNDLIEKINTIKNQIYIPESDQNYNITPDEAYVMGLFFADGTCGIYKWNHTYKNKNRPRVVTPPKGAYTSNRTSYNWAISNTNLLFLEKAKQKMEQIYNYEFVIIEDRHNHIHRSNCKPGYKLQMNGCRATENLVTKYRSLFYDNHKFKKLPMELLNSSYDVRFNFFHGYYDGDGHKGSKWYEDQTKPSYECDKLMCDVYGKITAHGLYYLCRSIGYEVTINTNENKPNIYTLNLTKGKIQDNPNRIKKIIDLGVTEQYVYDLETSNHHFQAGIGCMIVHNTDGYHIKGLLLNFIHYFWPSLLKVDDFVTCLTTPIVKATKGKEVKVFYNLTDYEEWKKTIQGKWQIKYYKGLGTSDAKEAREYFTDINDKLINYMDDDTLLGETFIEQTSESESESESDNDAEQIEAINMHTNTQGLKLQHEVKTSPEVLTVKVTMGVKAKHQDPCTESITLAFDKKRANDRKVWLGHYSHNNILNNSQKKVSISDFINKELIHFSNEDNNRSIPSSCDGLKPSQRKVLYGTILKRLNTKENEIRVAQLAGFVSERTCYHHGEASLTGTITNMAQNYVGSNNINLLYPSGQFGTRLMGGKDHASPRYIHTYLAELTKLIFRPEDDPILKYLYDDGIEIEPEYFIPIIPMVLINGTEGIGTGYSTKIPNYDPLLVIDNLLAMIEDKPVKRMIPWYKNFKGTVLQVPDKQSEFMIYGCISKLDNSHVKVTELPIGTWTTDYREDLDKLEANGMILGHVANNTEETVDITIEIDPDKLTSMLANNSIYAKLKLVTKRSTGNMHLYNSEGMIQKYSSPIEILEDFYAIRYDAYVARKKYIIGKLTKELNILEHKVRFIQDILSKQIIIERKKKTEIIARLEELNYTKLATDNDKESYEYLINIPILSLSEEKINELEEKYKNKEQELIKVNACSEEESWKRELFELREQYIVWLENYKIQLPPGVKTRYVNGEVSKKKQNPITKSKSKSKKNDLVDDI